MKSFYFISLLILSLGFHTSLSADDIQHGTIEVIENDTANETTSVTLSLSTGSSSGVSIDTSNSNRGDYELDFSTTNNDVADGVLISSVAENGRDPGDGIKYATSGIAINNDSTQYFIPIHQSVDAASQEFNINASFAWFPYSDWIGGVANNSSNGGAIDSFTGSSGINLGTEFIDHADGSYTLDHTVAQSSEGILLVCSAENEDNYALSRANNDGSFTIYSHDNFVNGAVYERDSVAFVYLPFNTTSSKIIAFGRINGPASTGAANTVGNFTIEQDGGTWTLAIPDHSPNTGTLIFSPEGGDDFNVDNILSSQWDSENDQWVIQSRDLTGLDLQGTGEEDAFSFAFIAEPIRIYVDVDADGSGDGASWTDAYTDLQDALAVASSGSQIWVAQGTYYPDQGTAQTAGDRTSTFQLRNEVALYGGFTGTENDLTERDPAAHPTILSGDLDGDDGTYFENNSENAYHVVTGSGTTATAMIDGFTITAGNANGSFLHIVGAGLYNEEGSPTLNNCSLSGNYSTGLGGAIYNDSSSPTLNNCSLSDNSASLGGAIYNLSSSPTLNDCSLSDNWTYDGGAIYNDSSSPTLNNCSLSGNSADYGGAIYNDSSSPTLNNCSLSGNSADYGGAIYNDNDSSSPTLNNCSLSGNSADDDGGAIYNDFSSSTTLNNCSLSDNSASLGGAIFNSSSSPTLNNCSLSGNSADGSGGAISNDSSSPTLNNCSLSGNSADGSGGAISNEYYSSPTLNNCSLSDNSAYSGGAIYNLYSSPTLNNCSLSGNNSARLGGAILNSSSSPTLNNCSLSGNSVDYDGGAIYNSASSPTLNNCFLSGNSADYGGAIYNYYYSSPTLNNCSLSGNSADYDGGAIYNRTYSSPTLNNCSLSGNSADYDGGAIYNRTYSSPTLTNCIIWNNQASGSGDTNSASVINYSDASAPSYGYCLIQNIDLSASGNNFDGTDPGNNPLFILDVDPSLAPTTAGDLRLRTGSPAINAGDGISGFSTNTTTYDLVGNTRFVGTIDLGAYEGAYTTFANDFPALNANDDANGNGLSNYLDYAMGVDPTTIADSNSGTKLIGDRLTFNSRAYAADVRSTFKKSTDLSTWSPMVENVDYTHVQTNNNGVQDQVTIQLTNELLAEPTLFFTEEFTTE